ncbi:argonaut-like protein [Anaeramoeba flamelloides]|uniref:Argonaut-like protein n=1 Tax=Anaeramoeba flamelloides TaxID=1746091 RepID=A0AAV7Z8C3_9EUKA|nr:argonaut-like protein [Anaeramoeba flamelloides]
MSYQPLNQNSGGDSSSHNENENSFFEKNLPNNDQSNQKGKAMNTDIHSKGPLTLGSINNNQDELNKQQNQQATPLVSSFYPPINSPSQQQEEQPQQQQINHQIQLNQLQQQQRFLQYQQQKQQSQQPQWQQQQQQQNQIQQQLQQQQQPQQQIVQNYQTSEGEMFPQTTNEYIKWIKERDFSIELTKILKDGWGVFKKNFFMLVGMGLTAIFLIVLLTNILAIFLGTYNTNMLNSDGEDPVSRFRQELPVYLNSALNKNEHFDTSHGNSKTRLKIGNSIKRVNYLSSFPNVNKMIENFSKDIKVGETIGGETNNASNQDANDNSQENFNFNQNVNIKYSHKIILNSFSALVTTFFMVSAYKICFIMIHNNQNNLEQNIKISFGLLFKAFSTGKNPYIGVLLIKILQSIFDFLPFKTSILTLILQFYLYIILFWSTAFWVHNHSRFKFKNALILPIAVVHKNFFKIILLCILLMFVNLLGTLIIGIGLLVSFPFSLIIIATSYEKIFGLFPLNRDNPRMQQNFVDNTANI